MSLNALKLPAAARRGEPESPQAADNNGRCRLRCPGPVFSANRSRTGDARILRRARNHPLSAVAETGTAPAYSPSHTHIMVGQLTLP